MTTDVDACQEGLKTLGVSYFDPEILLKRQSATNMQQIENVMGTLLQELRTRRNQLKQSRWGTITPTDENSQDSRVTAQALNEVVCHNPLVQHLENYFARRVNDRAVYYGRKYGGGIDRGMDASLGDWPGEASLFSVNIVLVELKALRCDLEFYYTQL